MSVEKRAEEGLPGLWCSEWINENIIELYRVNSILYRGNTKYQRVEVVETSEFGRCLLLDGKMQSSLSDEHVYHESLVHPALVTRSLPRNVLIIGGGEGATAREASRWESVEELLMVEIDEEVVEICRRHLPEMSGGVFEDPRLKLIIAEGREYLQSLPDGYLDAVIIDITDPLEGGPSYLLFTKQFYSIAYSKLNERGVLATQATSPAHNGLVYASVKKTLKNVFPHVTSLHVYIKSFSSMWGFIVASKHRGCDELTAADVEGELRRGGVSGLKFYSGDIHRAMITSAAYNDSRLGNIGRTILDEEPLFIK